MDMPQRNELPYVEPSENVYGGSSLGKCLLLCGVSSDILRAFLSQMLVLSESVDLVFSREKPVKEWANYEKIRTFQSAHKGVIQYRDMDGSFLHQSYNNVFLLVNNRFGVGYENFFEFINNVDFKIAYLVNRRLQTFRLGSGYMKFLNGLTNPSGSLSQSTPKKRNENLKVLVDASLISNHEDTGLSKYTKGLVRSLYECENIDLYLILQDLDIFPGLKCNKILFDTVLNVDIRAKFINHIVGNYDIDLFISPYFDVPAGIQCKTVQVVLDLIPLRFPAFYESSNSYAFFNERIRRSCSYVDLILTISRATQKDIQYFYVVSPSKICVAYPGLGTNSKSISAHQPDRSIKKRSFFLSVGTLEPRKGVTLLLEAYEAFRVKLESAGAEGVAIPDLCLVGKFGWDCEKEKALISKLKCHGVKHLGYVNDDTLVSLYGNAVASIFPSYYEGFGLPIIESFHYGAPVITFKNSSLDEVAGDAALYPSTQDVKGLSVAMFTLFSEPDLAKTLTRKGKKRAEFFTWDNHRKMLYSGISGLFPR